MTGVDKGRCWKKQVNMPTEITGDDPGGWRHDFAVSYLA